MRSTLKIQEKCERLRKNIEDKMCNLKVKPGVLTETAIREIKGLFYTLTLYEKEPEQNHEHIQFLTNWVNNIIVQEKINYIAKQAETRILDEDEIKEIIGNESMVR